MIVGMHFSIAGKYYKAVERAEELGCNALQIFGQNPRGWRGKVLQEGEADKFRSLVGKYGIEAVVVHTPYLINLASANPELRHLSRRGIRGSLERADLLGAQYVVTHIGSARGRERSDAIGSVSHGLDEVFRQDYRAQLLLENTAGSGHIVGSSFEELAEIISGSNFADRLFLCLDTAHAYAAGYDVATKRGLDETLDDIKRHLGLERLKVIHANDTRSKLGSRVDRHYHIGRGNIGRRGFRNIVNHPKLSRLPFILETPIDKECDDVCNLKAFRSLVLP